MTSHSIFEIFVVWFLVSCRVFGNTKDPRRASVKYFESPQVLLDVFHLTSLAFGNRDLSLTLVGKCVSIFFAAIDNGVLLQSNNNSKDESISNTARTLVAGLELDKFAARKAFDHWNFQSSYHLITSSIFLQRHHHLRTELNLESISTRSPQAGYTLTMSIETSIAFSKQGADQFKNQVPWLQEYLYLETTSKSSKLLRELESLCLFNFCPDCLSRSTHSRN